MNYVVKLAEYMNIETKKMPNHTLIFLRGRIDIVIAEEIDNDINFLITTGTKNLIIDLKEITYFSSSGVRMLITAKNKAEELGGKFILININSTVEKILNTLGLEKKFDICHNLDDAAQLFTP